MHAPLFRRKLPALGYPCLLGKRRHIGQSDGSYDVFVSFASENRSTAEAAVQALELHGYKCWVAWRDIPNGVPYAAAIVQGIRAARLLLILLTPESRSSPHVLREVECAVSANRPILSMQIAGCLPGESLAYYLAPTEWLRNEQTEIDGDRLVAAVSKLAKDAKSAKTESDAKRNWPALFRNALRSPAAILSATGLALLGVMEAIAHFIPPHNDKTVIYAIENRGILLALLSSWLAASTFVEGAIENRRGPYNPLRGRLVPSYAIAAGLFLFIGFWVWSLATNYSVTAIFWDDHGFVGIPDFLLTTGDTTSIWRTIHTAFSNDGKTTILFDWRDHNEPWTHGLSPLILIFGTGMVLGAVALCVLRPVRSPALAISILAMLPFLLVGCALGGDIVTPPVYWFSPVFAALLSLGLRKLSLHKRG